VTQRLQPEKILRHLATVTATLTGQDFFYCLVRELAMYIGADDVFLTVRPDPEAPVVHTLACWRNSAFQPNFSYSLTDAAACRMIFEEGQVMQFSADRMWELSRAAHVADERLPLDAYYLGIPMIDNQKTIIGHLAVIDKQPVEADLIPILQIFAARASAELERIRADQKRRTSEDRYRHLFENSPQPILVFDVNTLFYTNVNEAALRMYGYTRAEFLSLSALQLRPTHDEAAFRQTLRMITECQHLYMGEWKHKRKDGVIFDVECNCSVFETGGRDYMMSIITDVSERQRLEEERQQAALDERNRLARELHDSVNQTLWSAALIADVLPELWALDEQNGRRKLEQLRHLNRTALAEMRALLLELRPAAVVEAQLGDLLQRLVDALLTPMSVQVTLDVEGEVVLPPELKTALYRITQEAFNNIIRHSEAKHVRVLVCSTTPGWKLLIVDDGCGFDSAATGVESIGHMGLHIMRERAQQAGAQLIIQSRMGHGTEVAMVWQA